MSVPSLLRPFRIGELELLPLLDRHFRLDGGAMFGVVPKPLWEKRAPADERNRITMAMRPLLVRGLSAGSGQASRLMIIDAGAGEKMEPKLQEIYGFERSESLDASLTAAGVRRGDIEIVLATHLHFDHAGGFTARDPSGAAVPAFPNARYIINAGEWEDATHPHERNRASYFEENYVPLRDAGRVDFMDGDGEVMPGVRVRRTGGHTRWHQIVYLESGGQTAVFAADLMPTTAHVDVPWIMGYDLYPMDTLAFKRAFVREAIEKEYIIFFEHDPQIAAGYIREKDRRLFVERADL
jgi:glyoxylase-like metal-dependent hydrolase (beta-lactamase superfamily II)